VYSREKSTIVALATPVGISGIAVIRVSGSLTLDIASHISGFSKEQFKNRYAIFSPICNTDCTEIDNGIITFFKGPHSYTGEDVLEISCHGGRIIPELIINTCIYHGCQPAEPGEFTKRAFLNGKMDLSQAEAVADIISAKNSLSQKFSYRILSGKFSNLINQMKDDLMNIVSLIEAELDFSDEEIQPTPKTKKIDMIDLVITGGSSLLETYSTGRLLKNGAIVSIIGKPNVGKSSLLNAMISEERAIVTELPGTTRDVIEVFYQIDDFPIRFIDTAGLRKTDHPIEVLGIEFSQKYISKSDLVLWVFDIHQTVKSILQDIKKPFFDAPFIIVINKADLFKESKKWRNNIIQNGFDPVIVSALEKSGLDQLTCRIVDSIVTSNLTDQEIVLTNTRHKKAIQDTISCLDKAKELLTADGEQQLVAFEIREALSHLDRILGITTADDILDNIFASFCVGK